MNIAEWLTKPFQHCFISWWNNILIYEGFFFFFCSRFQWIFFKYNGFWWEQTFKVSNKIFRNIHSAIPLKKKVLGWNCIKSRKKYRQFSVNGDNLISSVESDFSSREEREREQKVSFEIRFFELGEYPCKIAFEYLHTNHIKKKKKNTRELNLTQNSPWCSLFNMYVQPTARMWSSMLIARNISWMHVACT